MNRVALLVWLVVLAGAGKALANSAAALETVLQDVDLREVPAERAFAWLAAASGFNLVISWDQLEAVGYDRRAPITVKLRGVKARTVLRLMLTDTFPNADVLAEVEPAYVRIRTKEAANKDAVIKTYDIADLIFEPEPYADPPDFSLTDIQAQNDGGGSTSIFETSATERPTGRTREERIAQIADTIRQTIEPDIWRANGGVDGEISYANGMLVVRAPEYVHQRIGLPTMSPQAAAAPPAVARMARYETAADGTGAGRSLAGVGTLGPAHTPAPRWGAYRYAPTRGNRISAIDWTPQVRTSAIGR